MTLPLLPEDYTDATTPTGSLHELPATGPRGLNNITDRINTNTADITTLQNNTVPENRQIIAGAFMSGGGDLSANRTISLGASGTPGPDTFLRGDGSWAVPGTVVTPVLELTNDFTDDADGAVSTTVDTGQTWTIGWAPTSASTPAISVGRYTDPCTLSGPSASYLTAHLTAPCTYLSGVFNFSSTGTTNGQAAVLACWDISLPSGSTSVTTQNSPAHVVFSNDHYDYGVFAAGTYTVLGQHFYVSGAMGTATQTAEIQLDRPNNRATVKGPDGVSVQFTDSRIGVGASYVTCEIFHNTASTDNRVRFQRFTATTTPPTVGGSGVPNAHSVGWNELNATGTPTTTTFLKVNSDLTLSAATPAGGSGGSITSASITDAGTVGIASLQATTQAAGRAAIGVGGATVTAYYANVVDYGADPSGVADSAAAFRSAGNVTGSVFRPIFIPQGSYKLNSTPFTTGALDSMSITGAHGGYNSPAMGARLNLAAGVRLVDTAVIPDTFHCEGVVFVSGAGAFRWTNTGNAVRGHRTIKRCGFMNYTNAAISTEMQDNCYWYISDCLFYAANCTTSMGIAMAGWQDNSEFSNLSFLLNRVHVKICRMGPNIRLNNLDLLRFADNQGFPRVDIWFPTMINPSPIGQNDVAAFNAGVAGGIEITQCKFGNEFYNAGDHRILIADEGTGTYVGDRFPVIANSTGLAGGISAHHLSAYPSGVGVLGLVHSTTPNLVGCLIGPIWCSVGTTALLNLRNATGFNPALNIVGPAITMSGINNTTLTTAQSGTLTGQCKTQVVA